MKIHVARFVRTLILAVLFSGCGAVRPGDPASATAAGRLPAIAPDYAGVVIPPNIAPLNFRVKEAGTAYYLRISSTQGTPIEVSDAHGRFQIPLAPWKALLAANTGQPLHFEVFVCNEQGVWTRFNTIENTVAAERVDPYLAFRRMVPWYVTFREMDIYQRCVENFEERPLIENTVVGDPGEQCNNCHSFSGNRPDEMTIHARFPFLMVIARHGEVKAVDTRTELNTTPFAYAALHPNGKFAVYSVNKIVQFFHNIGDTRDVFDYVSDLLLYDFDTNMVSAPPPIATADQLETFPSWSPDGRYLYFCRTVTMPQADFPKRYREVKYDLVRIPFDPAANTWGEVEMVLSAAESGASAGLPRVSPDGRLLAFSLSAYGTFPLFHTESDLYLMNLETRKFDKLACNSDKSESWHEWSTNGRWMVFSSKRRDGLLTLPYFSFIDADGRASKPFVLPQEDPGYYEQSPETYSAPEFLTGPVPYSEQSIADVFHQEKDAPKSYVGTREHPGTREQCEDDAAPGNPT